MQRNSIVRAIALTTLALAGATSAIAATPDFGNSGRRDGIPGALPAPVDVGTAGRRDGLPVALPAVDVGDRGRRDTL